MTEHSHDHAKTVTDDLILHHHSAHPTHASNLVDNAERERHLLEVATVTDDLIHDHPANHPVHTTTTSLVLAAPEETHPLTLVDHVQRVHDRIEAALSDATSLANRIDRGVAGRETALTITKLEEARHRAVDAILTLQRP